jgi:hypothetical protein
VRSLGAIGFAVKPRLLPRNAWIGTAVAGFLGAGLLSSIAVIEIENPLAATPGPEEATEVVTRLVGNLHTAQQIRHKGMLREAMAHTVALKHLDEVMPEVRRALAIEIQGGGIAQIDSVDEVAVRNIESLGGGAFRTRTEWRANASAGHWGHLHRRRVHFSALMEVMPSEEVWKLTGLTVMDVRQEK